LLYYRADNDHTFLLLKEEGMPRYSDGQPDEEQEPQFQDQQVRKKVTVMDLAIEASRKGTAASYEQQPSGNSSIFIIAAVGVIVMLVVIVAISMLGSNDESVAMQNAEVASVPQITMPPAATVAPQSTAVPTPTGIQLSSVGTDAAIENKLEVNCGGQPLYFSLMLRKRASDGRLEVTLVTNREVPIDALRSGGSGTLLAPGTQCGVNVSWDGSTARYTAVEQ
jgi:hypothetical protein